MMNPNEPPVFKVLPNLMQDILATSVSMSHTVSSQLMDSMDLTLKPSGVPLSQCALWEQQFEYYSQKGISAWESCVPFLVTNSTYMAESYADLILAFLKDYQDKMNMEQPLYIIELSAGTGRFAFHLLRELTKKTQHFGNLSQLPIRYVMTDITESHTNFWYTHEKLQPFVEAGILDFAVYRPEDSSEINLKHSGKTLSTIDSTNPTIVIANYLFDTIRHDLFRAENRMLMEGLVTISKNETMETDNEESDGFDFSKLTMSVEYSPIKDNYYLNPKLNEVLKYYQDVMDHENFIIPIGAFNCIENLKKITNGNMVLLSSDKGYTSTKQLKLFQEHNFAAHGSFSYPVNYDAINQYYAMQGKPWFITNSCSSSLNTACYIDISNSSEISFENVASIYAHKLSRTQPSISLLTFHSIANIIHCPTPHREMLTIIIGMLKASYCEPQLFCELAPKMLESFHLADQTQLIDIMDIMMETWSHYYYFKGECQLPFWMAQVYERMNALDQCIYFLNESIRYQGPHEALLFLIGDCHERSNRVEEARQSFYDAIMIKPDFQDAHERFMQLAAAG